MDKRYKEMRLQYRVRIALCILWLVALFFATKNLKYHLIIFDSLAFFYNLAMQLSCKKKLSSMEYDDSSSE